jgi:ribonuclease P protein component
LWKICGIDWDKKGGYNKRYVYNLETKKEKEKEGPWIFEKKKGKGFKKKEEKRKMEIMPLKKWRLKEKEFEKVLKRGQSFREDVLVLKVLRNFSLRKRIGFLVTKKAFSKAVLRNKIKRKLRELMRAEVENIKEGLDLVFIPLPGIEKKDFNQLANIFKKLILKAKILK